MACFSNCKCLFYLVKQETTQLTGSKVRKWENMFLSKTVCGSAALLHYYASEVFATDVYE